MLAESKRAARTAAAGLAASALLTLLGIPSCRKDDGFVFRGAPVVIISVDTLRADHLPAYGYRGVETPNLDALRKDAVLFENAYPIAAERSMQVEPVAVSLPFGDHSQHRCAPPQATTLAANCGASSFSRRSR